MNRSENRISMQKLFTLLLITVFFFLGCDSKTEKKTTKIPLITKSIGDDDALIEKDKEIFNYDLDLLAQLPLRDLPIIDSTTFDNVEKSGVYDTGFLKRIKFDPGCNDATDFRLKYKIPFSEGFTSIVVSHQCGEHELFATLITVDKKYKIIDKLQIAYDEIAESAFGKRSQVEKEKIVITSTNWMNEEPIFETETYVLQNNGKFKKM
ncbi:hypothetical protein [Sphingobacterium sp. BIGb0165]|uniref:hypothetical protein n=1 Tax=Sphingobacterium sp. BIGb0165 TaxID=2940615 RepID=UPI0021681F3C|nr:hypothetical protein [Sphingobacterium sp. BIGb0165]MCS4224549.1 hypothetical protein [Sphingobacterium sp. BIGb0165]